MSRNTVLPAIAVFLVVFAVAAGGFVASRLTSPGASGGAALTMAERFLRDDATSGVSVQPGAVPAVLEQILNNGTTNAADRLTLPVHPKARLIGSSHLHQPDGSDLVWLMYDVDGDLATVSQTVTDQLNQSPWQVTAGRGEDTARLLRFQNSRLVDLQGSATIRILPARDSYRLTVSRGGKEMTLTVKATALAPSIGETQPDLTVTRVGVGPVQEAGVQKGDKVVRVNDTAVKTQTALASALATAVSSGATKTAVTYILANRAPGGATPAAPPVIALPQQALPLPSTFPAAQAWQGLVVIGYQWEQQQGQKAYRAAMVSKEPSTAVANRLRDGLKAAGWEVTGDQPVGFATQLQIAHQGQGLVGQVTIDQLPQDSAYIQVVVEIQGAPAAGKP